VIIQTRDFGAVEVPRKQVYRLTEPILGFETCRRYALLEEQRTKPILWLQSIETANLVFPLVEADFIGLNYTQDLAKIDLDDIGADDPDDLRVMLIVVIPQDVTQVRANLRAPLLLHPQRGLGKQVVLYDSTYPIQFRLISPAEEHARPVGCR